MDILHTYTCRRVIKKSLIIIIIIYIYIAPFQFSSMALYNFEIDNIKKKITRVIEFTLIAKNTSYEYAI